MQGPGTAVLICTVPYCCEICFGLQYGVLRVVFPNRATQDYLMQLFA